MSRKPVRITALNILILLFVESLFFGQYEPTRQSCAQHRQPEWFQDAKLGLYAHWCPRTLAFEEAPFGGANWDLEQAYEPGSDCNAWWNQHWGDPTEFGMKDVCQLFNPVNFDADEWAQLAVDAGAKFGGMYAGHRANFSMFDDPGTSWNSVDTGMRKMDYQAALADAYRAKGLKVTVGFHFSEAWRIYTTVHEYGDGASAPELYTDYHTSYSTPMTTNFKETWVQKIKSAIDASDPDHIAMLAGHPMELIEEEYYWQIFSYFFNQKGDDGVMVCKGNTYDKINDDNIAFDNHEMGFYGTEIKPDVFEVDQTLGGWFYQTRMEDLEFTWGINRNPNKLRQLADIVSKNGVMLLNTCPKADGSIAEHVQVVLREMGDWLAINGESIYFTRPFYTHGEGPNKLSSTNNYTNATHLDMRFTQSKDGMTVYCILFDWPGNDSVVNIESMGSSVWDGEVESVDMLNGSDDLAWNQTPESLVVTTPPSRPSHDHMYVLRVNLKSTPMFIADFNSSVSEENTDNTNINLSTIGGQWNNISAASAHIRGTGSDKVLLIDQTTGGFAVKASMDSPISVNDATVSFKTGLRRIGPDESKNIHITGLDSLGNKSFEVVVCSYISALDEDQLIGYIDPSFGLRVVSPSSNGDIAAVSDAYNPNLMAEISLVLSGEGYVVKYLKGSSSWVSSILPYAGSASELHKLVISSNVGGIWLDDIKIEYSADINPADINSDGKVDLTDFSFISQQWNGNGSSSPSADIAPSFGIVDINDFSLFTECWLQFSETIGKAEDPDPANGADQVAVFTNLSWVSGLNAEFHDIYLGTDLNNVNNAVSSLAGDVDGDGSVDFTDLSNFALQWLGNIGSANLNGLNGVDLFDFSLLSKNWQKSVPPEYRGRYSSNSFIPSQLDGNTIYYWRVDEVKGDTIRKGDVWSFTTAPFETASISVDYMDILTEKPPIGDNTVYFLAGDYLTDSSGTITPEAWQISEEIGLDIFRYPAGNVHNHDWKRALGPQSQRPDQLQRWWADEGFDSRWGPDEAARYAKNGNGALCMVINTNRDAQDAADYVEYMNCEVGENPNGGIDWAQVRADNGHPEPYNMKLWEISNESGGKGTHIWPNWPAVGDDPDTAHTQGETYAENWWIWGGTRSFTDQRAFRYSGWWPSKYADYLTYDIDKSNGDANEEFYVKFPPVDSITQLHVGTSLASTTAWTEVADLNSAGPADEVFYCDHTTGQILFGDGVNGKKLPNGYYVYVDYDSGPHDGYVDYYRQMKAVDPDIIIATTHHLFWKRFYDLPVDVEIDGFQKHMGLSYETDNTGPAGGDFFTDYIGRAYFTFPRTIDSFCQLLTNNSIPSGKLIVQSENSLLERISNDTVSGVRQYRTIKASLANCIMIERAMTLYGQHTKYPMWPFMKTGFVNQARSVEKWSNQLVTTAIGRSQEFMIKHFGDYVLNDISRDTPAYNIPWQGDDGSQHTGDVPKVVMLVSKDTDGNIYALGINTTKETIMISTVNIENGFDISSKPVESWTLLADSPNSINDNNDPDRVRIEFQSNPSEVEIIDLDTFNFVVHPYTSRIIKIIK